MKRLILFLSLCVGPAFMMAADQGSHPDVGDFARIVKGREQRFPFNFGPTGATGWFYEREFVINGLDKGSPADGVLKINDRIRAVNGVRFPEALAFTDDERDPRRVLGDGITQAEAKDGRLVVTVWRNNREQDLIWGPIGASRGTPEQFRLFMDYWTWFHDLGRRWDGSFLLPSQNDGAGYAARGPHWTMGGQAMLYALPLKLTRVCGATESPFDVSTMPGELAPIKALVDQKQYTQAAADLDALLAAGLDGKAKARAQWMQRSLRTTLASIDHTLAAVEQNLQADKNAPLPLAVMRYLAFGDGIIWTAWATRNRLEADKLLGEFPFSTPLAATSDSGKVDWKYVTMDPLLLPGGWNTPGFDDSAWQESAAPVCSPTQRRKGPENKWDKPFILLRRTFEVADPAFEALRIKAMVHDEADIYLNGVHIARILKERAKSTAYSDFDVTPAGLPALRKGTNVLAVKAARDGGHIDLGIMGVKRP